jgi:hypothetical protein
MRPTPWLIRQDVYPKDQNIGRYTYPDYREWYRLEDSWQYGKPAEDAGLV